MFYFFIYLVAVNQEYSLCCAHTCTLYWEHIENTRLRQWFSNMWYILVPLCLTLKCGPMLSFSLTMSWFRSWFSPCVVFFAKLYLLVLILIHKMVLEKPRDMVLVWEPLVYSTVTTISVLDSHYENMLYLYIKPPKSQSTNLHTLQWGDRAPKGVLHFLIVFTESPETVQLPYMPRCELLWTDTY